MKKFDLIDINEDILPDVELSDEQKKNLKKIFKNLINPYLSLDKNSVDIDLSNSNLSKITNNLGNSSKEVLNHVRGGKILRDLVIEALDKDCPIKENDILYKTLLYIPIDYSFKTVGVLYSNSVFSHRIYVTKDELFIYNLDNYFRVINTTKLPLTYIKSAFISKYDKKNYIPFSCNTLIINLDKSTKNNLSLPSTYYLVGEKGENAPELYELLNTLYSLGVNTNPLEVTSKEKTKNLIITVIAIIFFILLFISQIVLNLPT